MGKMWRLMGRYDSETTAYTECAGAGVAAPFTPDFDGKLVGLRGICGGGAATALINHIQFKLTCNMFKPNSIECAIQGAGLQTAPFPQPNALDWPVDQPVKAGVPITIEGRNVTADTPVGVDVELYGQFEVS